MMNLENLVEISSNNNQVVTDSLVVAKVFGKRHDNVIRDIKGLLKNEDTQKMFYTSTYTEKQNKQRYIKYYMNRDGFSLLVMGFTGKEALSWKLKYKDLSAAEEAFDTIEQRRQTILKNILR